MKKLLISVVNHHCVNDILYLIDFLSEFNTSLFRVNLIDNTGEFRTKKLNYEFLDIVHSDGKIRGFGANHNLSLNRDGFSHILILNPDVKFIHLDINELLSFSGMFCTAVTFREDMTLGDFIRVEESVIKTLFGRFFRYYRVRRQISSNSKIWFPGAFLVLTFNDFVRIGGFDERYFMYYEDADLCRRLRGIGVLGSVFSNTKIVHQGQRRSLNSFRHFRWHFTSFLRFNFNLHL